MLLVPNNGKWLKQHNLGGVGTTTPGTAVTTGASAGTKGTVTELIASADFDVCLIEIIASGYNATNTQSKGCLDILVGAATESLLIVNLLMGACGVFNGANGGPKTWRFPVYLPAGTRISAQAAGDRTSTAMRVGIKLVGGLISPPWRVGRAVETYGVSSVPAGTAITAGASGAEGSWTEVVASTIYDHFCFEPSLQLGADTAINSRGLALDIGFGAATEELAEEGYLYSTGGDESISGPWASPWPLMMDIPAATRAVMRLSNSGANDNYECALHGVR